MRIIIEPLPAFVPKGPFAAKLEKLKDFSHPSGMLIPQARADYSGSWSSKSGRIRYFNSRTVTSLNIGRTTASRISPMSSISAKRTNERPTKRAQCVGGTSWENARSLCGRASRRQEACIGACLRRGTPTHTGIDLRCGGGGDRRRLEALTKPNFCLFFPSFPKVLPEPLRWSMKSNWNNRNRVLEGNDKVLLSSLFTDYHTRQTNLPIITPA